MSSLQLIDALTKVANKVPADWKDKEKLDAFVKAMCDSCVYTAPENMSTRWCQAAAELSRIFLDADTTWARECGIAWHEECQRVASQ